jgi:hypothetical protein
MMIRNAVIATTILAASTGFAFAQTGAQSGQATTKPDQPVVNDKAPAQMNNKAATQHIRKPSATTGSGAAIKQEEQERFSSPADQQKGGDVEREK